MSAVDSAGDARNPAFCEEIVLRLSQAVTGGHVDKIVNSSYDRRAHVLDRSAYGWLIDTYRVTDNLLEGLASDAVQKQQHLRNDGNISRCPYPPLMQNIVAKDSLSLRR